MPVNLRARRGRDPPRRRDRVDLVLVIVAPGQGAQSPGFLSPWLENPTFAERLGWLSAVGRARPGALRLRGRRGDHPRHRRGPAAAGRLRAARRARAVPAPGRRLRDASARSPGTASASSPPPPARAPSPPSRRWCWCASAARRWLQPPREKPTSMTAVLGWGPRRGARQARAARPHRRQRQRPRPDRRGRHRRAARRPRRRPARQGPADAAVRRRCVPHRAHGACGRRARPDSPARSPPTTPRTPIISNRDGQVVHEGAEMLRRIVSQVQQPRCAGTSAWRRCSTSASPACSRCRPRARSPASPGAR